MLSGLTWSDPTHPATGTAPGQKEDPLSYTFEGRRLHYVLPSFFELMATLCRRAVHNAAAGKFSVVIRTYGTDREDVARAIKAFCDGQHPLFPTGSAAELACRRRQLCVVATGNVRVCVCVCVCVHVWCMVVVCR